MIILPAVRAGAAEELAAAGGATGYPAAQEEGYPAGRGRVVDESDRELKDPGFSALVTKRTAARADMLDQAPALELFV